MPEAPSSEVGDAAPATPDPAPPDTLGFGDGQPGFAHAATGLEQDGAGIEQAALPTELTGPAQPGSPGSEAPGTGGAAQGGRPPRRAEPWWRQLVEWVAVAVVALLVAVLLRRFVVQTFYVPSGSMIPTLQIGDRIIVNKLYGTIHRFDIIVFRRTPGDTTTTDADLVKRVIGLPGETIWSKGDTIYVNGKPINESWLPSTLGDSCPQASYDIAKTHIPANDYFVMGDCRGNSEDSRAWGFVPASYVVGKVFVIVWRNGHPWLHWF